MSVGGIKRTIRLIVFLVIIIFLVAIPFTITPDLQVKPAKLYAYDSTVAANISASFTMKSKPVKVGRNVKLSVKVKYNGSKLAGAQIKFVVTDMDNRFLYERLSNTDRKGYKKINIPTGYMQKGSTYMLTAYVYIDDWYQIGSGTITTKGTPPQGTGSLASTVIDDNTNLIGISPASKDQLLSIFSRRGSSKIDRASRLADLYIKYGVVFNIRADIAWAQMAHETGFLKFGGIVPENANNFAGIGATGQRNSDGSYKYDVFASEERGVIAHYAHLAWYVYPDHLNNGYCNSTYDPRHFGSRHNYRSSTLSVLNGTWAVGNTYTSKIIQFANEIYN
jgi:hypothetical protein